MTSQTRRSIPWWVSRLSWLAVPNRNLGPISRSITETHLRTRDFNDCFKLPILLISNFRPAGAALGQFAAAESDEVYDWRSWTHPPNALEFDRLDTQRRRGSDVPHER
jgi:hypothetical protein